MVKKTLTIGGSDTWGGGGIQTDLKTFENHATFGLSVLTCLAVAEKEAFAIRNLPSDLVRQQLQTIEASFQLDAIKIGLLSGSQTVEAVKEFSQKMQGQTPIVLDPVLAFKETQASYQQEYVKQILDLAMATDLVTPNLVEAAMLADFPDLKTLADVQLASQRIFDKTQTPVVIKGGARLAGEEALDYFYDGVTEQIFKGPKSARLTTNGAGCCFSAAICANLAQGNSLSNGIQKSKQFVYEAIENGLVIEGATGNVWHN
ncbi:MAG: hydroxymethylpyrimidine/phosphomethylpyrimidine kinase [Enterococcus sp.]